MLLTFAQAYIQGAGVVTASQATALSNEVGTAATQNSAAVVWLLVANP